MAFWAAPDDDAFQRHVGVATARPASVTYKPLYVDKSPAPMVDPDREPLEGVVEVDQAEIAFAKAIHSSNPEAGKILVIGAVEIIERDTIKPNRDASTPNISTRVPAAFAWRFPTILRLDRSLRKR
jgi:hypothetical protein